MNFDHQRAKLEAEKKELLDDLVRVGRLNPQNREDWEVTPLEHQEVEFRDELADQLEDMEQRQATELALEIRFKHVQMALKKLAAGAYGQCEVCGEAIEADRLEANAAARTCKTHLNEDL
jgi:RNA polymerase-binding transcription factor DksA